MQGAVVDFLFPVGHKELNKRLVKLISEIAPVTLVVQDGYDKSEITSNKNISIREIKREKIEKNIFLSRLYAIKNMFNTNKILEWGNYDFIWVNTFETITFAFGCKWIKNKNIYIVHHNNTDELSNRLKRFFFNSYKNKVNHIVFEEYIRSYLIDTLGVEENRVKVVAHPFKNSSKSKVKENLKKCVGLSNSNDKIIIDEIIREEVESKIFSKHDINILLKSSEEVTYKSLKVIKGFLKKEEYEKYINESTFVLAPFNLKYKYRTSGFIIDALASEKIVIGSNIPLMRSYAKKYPHICYYFEDVREIPSIVMKHSDIKEKISMEFSQFKLLHSDVEIKIQIEDILKEKATVIV